MMSTSLQLLTNSFLYYRLLFFRYAFAAKRSKFTEFLLSAVGFDIVNKKWSVLGTPSTAVSSTSMIDIGLSTASVVLLAYHNPDDVPLRIRISGHRLPFQNAEDIFAAAGNPPFEVEYRDVEDFRKSALERLPDATLTDDIIGWFDYIK